MILRPGQIFGGRIPLMTAAVARRAGGRHLVLGDGEMLLPLVYIDDVVDALRAGRQEQRCTGGEVIQIVDPESWTPEPGAGGGLRLLGPRRARSARRS